MVLFAELLISLVLWDTSCELVKFVFVLLLVELFVLLLVLLELLIFELLAVTVVAF